MKELTPEQIQHNWGNLRQLIDAEFTGERLEKLNEMYDYFEERMMFAPASGKEHFHNAHAGGYVEHVIHVTTSALKIKAVWEQTGATIDFTDEELTLGKALKGLKAATATPRGKLATLWQAIRAEDDTGQYAVLLERMGLNNPSGIREKLDRKLVIHGLQQLDPATKTGSENS